MNWRKSSYSSGNGGACVEVGAVSAQGAGHVLVRDTTDRQGPVLAVGADAWVRFTACLK